MVTDPLAERFEADRPHLRAVAYRMLGSLSDAEDAVQEAWIRLQRSDVDGVANLTGWLTTVVGRVCLDMLRSRTSRREEQVPDPVVVADEGADPEQEAALATSTRWSPCSTRTSCCAPTRAAAGCSCAAPPRWPGGRCCSRSSPGTT